MLNAAGTRPAAGRRPRGRGTRAGRPTPPRSRDRRRPRPPSAPRPADGPCPPGRTRRPRPRTRPGPTVRSASATRPRPSPGPPWHAPVAGSTPPTCSGQQTAVSSFGGEPVFQEPSAPPVAGVLAQADVAGDDLGVYAPASAIVPEWARTTSLRLRRPTSKFWTISSETLTNWRFKYVFAFEGPVVTDSQFTHFSSGLQRFSAVTLPFSAMIQSQAAPPQRMK